MMMNDDRGQEFEEASALKRNQRAVSSCRGGSMQSQTAWRREKEVRNTDDIVLVASLNEGRKSCGTGYGSKGICKAGVGSRTAHGLINNWANSKLALYCNRTVKERLHAGV
jgi:hypothetical protein